MRRLLLLFLFILSTSFVLKTPSESNYKISTENLDEDIFNSNLIITEIMYNPSNSDNAWEWVEIYNNTDATINLAGYVFDDDDSSPLAESNITEGVIHAGESAVLFNAGVRTAEQFTEAWGNVNLIPVNNWSALNNTGDSIAIWDSYENYQDDNATQQNAIVQISYDNNSNNWPNDDGSASIFLKSLELDPTVGDNWSLSEVGIETPLFSAYTSIPFGNNLGLDIGSPGLPNGEDNEAPVIVCNQSVVVSNDVGECYANVDIENPSATDNVSEIFVFEGQRNDQNELSGPFPIGETVITWTATDEAGNVSESCEQIITVVDQELPIIECNASFVKESSSGNPIVISIVAPLVNDNCEGGFTAIPLRSDNLDITAPFPLGLTTIVWRTVDAAGNEAECTQIIEVTEPLLSESEIVSFSLDNQIGETSIDVNTKTIELTMPFGSNLTSLLPMISISHGASIEPSLNEFQNFSEPVVYNVKAEDQTVSEWTVLINIDEEPNVLSILSFNLINADTELVIQSIMDGDIIDLNSLPTQNLNIQAVTTDDVESVRLELSGAQSNGRTENVAPYALYGDVSGDYMGFNFKTGNYNLSAIPYANSLLEGSQGASLDIGFQFIKTPLLYVNNYVLVNADTNTDIGPLTEGMVLNLAELPTTNLNIRATTTDDVESVEFVLSGQQSSVVDENVLPYAAFRNSGPNYYAYNFAVGNYSLETTPYSQNGLAGIVGTPLTVNFEVIIEEEPTLDLVITGFMLVDANTDEDIMLITEGLQINVFDLPTTNLNIRAITEGAVESVRMNLSGQRMASRTENVAPYALFGNIGTDYAGELFSLGHYTISSIPYSGNHLGGDVGVELSVNFELVTNEGPLLLLKPSNTMKISPNPAVNEVSLSFDTPTISGDIQVFDMVGRLVKTIKKSEYANGRPIGVTEFEAGMYFVKALDTSGQQLQKQMVIKR